MPRMIIVTAPEAMARIATEWAELLPDAILTCGDRGKVEQAVRDLADALAPFVADVVEVADSLAQRSVSAHMN